jgi:hypothetical protein
VTLKAKGGKGGARYNLRGLYVHGQYRFARRVNAEFTCTIGTSTTNQSANFEYTFRATKVKFVDGQWVASKLEGNLTEKASSTCSFLGTAEIKELIRASLVP